MLSDTEVAWLRLHLTRGLGRLGLFHLQSHFGSPQKALEAGPANWPARIGRRRPENLHPPGMDDPSVEQAIKRLETCRATIISFWDPGYPEQLKTIHDPPALLYLRGTFPDDDALAVVGARNASVAGLQLTTAICRQVAETGIAIISGLARGIDSAAHEGALAAGGSTLAVLGCGIDRVYPPENGHLHQRIAESGGIISEYPPGTEPRPGHFPGRNRIISGLSLGVLVVEAASGSGSLITADFALEQGREVFAVPGAISLPNSNGVNDLLKDGAHLVTAASDILDVFRRSPVAARRNRLAETGITLSEEEQRIISCLSEVPLHVDDLARNCGLTPMELSAILLQLEIREAVRQLPGMRYIRGLQPEFHP